MLVDGGTSNVLGKQKPDWRDVVVGGDKVDEVTDTANEWDGFGQIKTGGYVLLAAIKKSNWVLIVRHPVDASEKDYNELHFDLVEFDFDDIHGESSNLFTMAGSKKNSI